MKIASWNLCFDNQFQFENLNILLSKHDPDIVCLQEVNQKMLDILGTSSDFSAWNFTSCRDFERHEKYRFSEDLEESIQNSVAFLVIMSKEKFTQGNEEFTHHLPLKPSMATRHFRILQPRKFQFIDIKGFRIFNLHLEVSSGSARRKSEFNKVLSFFKKDGGGNIICGDLNIFSKFWINILIGWGFNFSIRDYFTNERRAFNRIFKKNALINVFSKKITFPKLRMQLDHILIPRGTNVKQVLLAKSPFDSDHKYIFVELDNC